MGNWNSKKKKNEILKKAAKAATKEKPDWRKEKPARKGNQEGQTAETEKAAQEGGADEAIDVGEITLNEDEKSDDKEKKRVVEKLVEKKEEQDDQDEEKIVMPDALLLQRQNSVEVVQSWITAYGNIENVMPEYRKAFEVNCINRDLITKSSTQHILEFLNEVIAKEKIKDNSPNDFKKIVGKLVKKAYKESWGKKSPDPAAQKCMFTQKSIVPSAIIIYSVIGWRQKYFHASLNLLEQSHEPSMLMAILADLCRASGTCIAGKKYGYSLVINLINPYGSGEGKDDKKQDDAPNRHLVMDYCREYVADFALKAFNMSFIEPLLMHHRSSGVLADCQLESHGINGLTALVNSAVGIPIPIPCLEDHCPDCGTMEFLSIEFEPYKKAIKALLLPGNFGKSYAAVKECDFPKGSIPQKHVKYYGGPFIFTKKATARDMAMQAIDPSEGNKTNREKYAPYLDNFMSFFAKEFFVEKCIGMLTVHRSKALQALFVDFVVQHPEITFEDDEDDDYRCWVWDIMDGSFRLDRAFSLLKFAGVCK